MCLLKSNNNGCEKHQIDIHRERLLVYKGKFGDKKLATVFKMQYVLESYSLQ